MLGSDTAVGMADPREGQREGSERASRDHICLPEQAYTLKWLRPWPSRGCYLAAGQVLGFLRADPQFCRPGMCVGGVCRVGGQQYGDRLQMPERPIDGNSSTLQIDEVPLLGLELS
jgi:hypothetical protein